MGRALANRCFLYEEEAVDHLLIHCSKTRPMWALFLAIVGVIWVFPRSVRDLDLLVRLFCGEEMQKGLVAALICILWTI